MSKRRLVNAKGVVRGGAKLRFSIEGGRLVFQNAGRRTAGRKAVVELDPLEKKRLKKVLEAIRRSAEVSVEDLSIRY